MEGHIRFHRQYCAKGTNQGFPPSSAGSQTWIRQVFELSFLGVRRTITNATWAEIRTAYASGIGLREIARNMGIPEGTVLARAKREGWTQQIQSAKALTKREDAPVVTATQAVAITMQQRGERHVERMAGLSEKVVTHVEALEPDVILEKIDKVEKADRVARRTYGLSDSDSHGKHFAVNIALLSVDRLQFRYAADAEG